MAIYNSIEIQEAELFEVVKDKMVDFHDVIKILIVLDMERKVTFGKTSEELEEIKAVNSINGINFVMGIKMQNYLVKVEIII